MVIQAECGGSAGTLLDLGSDIGDFTACITDQGDVEEYVLEKPDYIMIH